MLNNKTILEIETILIRYLIAKRSETIVSSLGHFFAQLTDGGNGKLTCGSLIVSLELCN